MIPLGEGYDCQHGNQYDDGGSIHHGNLGALF
jgi:hypothetical protein